MPSYTISEIHDLKDGNDYILKDGPLNEVVYTDTPYPSSAIVTIPDCKVPSNADVSVEFEPIQDLHGYSNPWAPGGGKNLLPLTVDGIKAANSGQNWTWNENNATYSGLTATILTDNDGNVTGININGTASNIPNFYLTNSAGLSNGTYYLNGGHSHNERIFFYDGTRRYDSENYAVQFTVDNSTSQQTCAMYLADGTYNNAKFYPMIRLASDPDSTFAPYSNICPISGRNIISITRCGKNLIGSFQVRHAVDNSGAIVSNSYSNITNKIVLSDATASYVLSDNIAEQITGRYVHGFDENDAYLGYFSITNGTSFIPNNNILGIKSVILQWNYYDKVTNPPTNAQFEKGTTATQFEHSGTDYTLSLNGTRYGGRVDISDTGEAVLTVDRKFLELDPQSADGRAVLGDYTRYYFAPQATDVDANLVHTTISNVAKWLYDWTAENTHFYISASQATVVFFIPTSSISSITSFQVCYPIAQPFQIPLKDTPIKLEKGTNNLYSDAGNISTKTNGITSAIGALTEQVNDITNELKGTVYTFHIDPDEADSYEAVTYHDDAVGMTPASMGATTFNYGSWAAYISKICRPCMLKFDGTVDYYLDPNDYSKKLDGTASDVADLSYHGNAMVEFPLIWWKSWGDGWVSIADYQVDATYKCWSNLDADGNIISYFYLPIYNGCIYDGKMRSISGIQLKPWSTTAYSSSATYAVGAEVNYNSRMWKCITAVETPEDFDSSKWEQFAFNGQTTGQEEITYATANNTTAKVEWYTDVWCDRTLINALLVLIGKCIDTQGTFGRGIDSGSRNAKESYITGSLNDKGLFYGSTSNGNTAVKVFGMENWWAYEWRRTAGLIGGENGTYLYKMTQSTIDGSTVDGYNTTGTGYLTANNRPNEHNWLKKMQFGNFGFLPLEVGSYSTQYYKDHYWTGTGYAIVGGDSDYVSICGAFFVNLNSAVGSRGWSVGAAPSCKPCLIKEAIVNE